MQRVYSFASPKPTVQVQTATNSEVNFVLLLNNTIPYAFVHLGSLWELRRLGTVCSPLEHTMATSDTEPADNVLKVTSETSNVVSL